LEFIQILANHAKNSNTSSNRKGFHELTPVNHQFEPGTIKKANHTLSVSDLAEIDTMYQSFLIWRGTEYERMQRTEIESQTGHWEAVRI